MSNSVFISRFNFICANAGLTMKGAVFRSKRDISMGLYKTPVRGQNHRVTINQFN